MMQVVDFQRVDALLRHLSAALAARAVYGDEHRRAKSSEREFLSALRGYLQSAPGDEFALGIRTGRFTCDGLVIGETSGLIRMASALESRGFTAIHFGKETDDQGVARLLAWALDKNAGEPARLPGIRLVRGDGDQHDDGAASDPFESFRVPAAIYGSAHALVGKIMDGATDGQIDFGEVMAVSQWTAEETFRIGANILSPVQILRNEPYTYRHSVNVFLITAAMMQPIAADPQELSRWVRAALLHDIGKCRLPHSVLYKDGTLDENERRLVQRHPELGVQVLMECGEMDPIVLEAAYCHHMRDDGLGYPEVGTPPITPGPVTRVIQVADMFEAIVAERPYKRAKPVDEAIRIIRGTPGLQSREQAVCLLEKTVVNTPAGAEVELEGSERGLVLGTDPTEVLVCWDKNGRPLDEPYRLDAEGTDARIVSVGLHACMPEGLEFPRGDNNG